MSGMALASEVHSQNMAPTSSSLHHAGFISSTVVLGDWRCPARAELCGTQRCPHVLTVVSVLEARKSRRPYCFRARNGPARGHRIENERHQ